MDSSQNLEQGRLITLTFEHDLPISVNLFWSALDDFFAISSATTGRTDVELIKESGKPSNGVGSEVSYTLGGKKYRETLLEKDDLNHVWATGISEPNEDFLYYRATLSAWEGAKGPMAKYTVDAILAGDQEHKTETLKNLKSADFKIYDICVFVLNRDGVKGHFEFDINCPVEKFWAILNDWSDVSWVMRSEGVEMLPDLFGRPNRKVISPGGSFNLAIQAVANPRTHTLVYYVYKSYMPVQMYQATVKLTVLADNKFRVDYDNVYLGKDGIDILQYKGGLEKTFNTMIIPFLQEKFGTKNE